MSTRVLALGSHVPFLCSVDCGMLHACIYLETS